MNWSVSRWWNFVTQQQKDPKQLCFAEKYLDQLPLQGPYLYNWLSCSVYKFQCSCLCLCKDYTPVVLCCQGSVPQKRLEFRLRQSDSDVINVLSLKEWQITCIPCLCVCSRYSYTHWLSWFMCLSLSFSLHFPSPSHPTCAHALTLITYHVHVFQDTTSSLKFIQSVCFCWWTQCTRTWLERLLWRAIPRRSSLSSTNTRSSSNNKWMRE